MTNWLFQLEFVHQCALAGPPEVRALRVGLIHLGSRHLTIHHSSIQQPSTQL